VFLLFLTLALLADAQPVSSTPAARQAVSRALPLLERSIETFVAQQGCVSCHHNSVAILTLRAARQHGFAVDPRVLEAVETKTLRQLRTPTALDDAIQSTGLSDPTPNDSYLLMAAHAAGLAPSMTTGVYARRISRWQRNGHWITSDFRPPHSSSPFTATATALRALQFYMPKELTMERQDASRRARRWLIETRPESTEDAAFRLMGLAWAEASAEERRTAARDLTTLQRQDGGWPQLPGYPSDAYSTGEALVALAEAGVPVTDDARQRGLRFLMTTQARDGSWRVRTRMLSPADISPPYFATGFPYGEDDEFLSFTGSCWAVMALLTSLPTGDMPAAPASSASSDQEPSWIRSALFGSTSELEGLLDKGLDPNSHTDRGTTLLMMVAPDAEKVQLLVRRGADVMARAPSGVDALIVAAAHYGTSSSVRLLLDAGASPDAPDGVRVRRPPLVLSAMTGDLDNVRLLLSHGTEASAEALSEAVTFGHAPIVQALVDAQVDVQLTEASGINLLHWATITNRPSVIPVLVKAGVPIDATDDFGFTPLMYAATVDVGDTAALQALLDAGATRNIRNGDGRTPLEQARRLRHGQIVNVLEHAASRTP